MPDTDQRLAAIEERLARIETKLDLLPFAFPNAPLAESRTTSGPPPPWYRHTPYEYENTGEGPAL